MNDSDITLTLTGTAKNGKERKEIFSYNVSDFNRLIPYSTKERWSECIFVYDNIATKWDEVYLYAYSKDGDTLTENAAYPGEKMTDEGQEFFSGKVSEKFKDKQIFVIFNNGKGEHISEGRNVLLSTKYPYGTIYYDGIWFDSNDDYDAYIPSTGHNHTIVYNEAVSPTETEPGSKPYYSCVGCEKLYSDSAGLNEVSKEELVIPPTTQKDNNSFPLTQKFQFYCLSNFYNVFTYLHPTILYATMRSNKLFTIPSLMCYALYDIQPHLYAVHLLFWCSWQTTLIFSVKGVSYPPYRLSFFEQLAQRVVLPYKNTKRPSSYELGLNAEDKGFEPSRRFPDLLP